MPGLAITNTDMRNNHTHLIACALTLTAAAQYCLGAFIVDDTWIDGTRNDPNPANNYSEFGSDLDNDGNIESAWFKGPSATTVTVVNDSPGVTPGIMRMDMPASGSASLTTYFAPVSAPVTLSLVGQQIRVTWVFTPYGVNSAAVGQGLRIGLVDWPETDAARLTSDAAPSSAHTFIFPGYAMFMNMNTTLAHSNPFQLMERSTTGSTFLANAAGWTSLADQENANVPGYADGIQYTFTFAATLNSLGGLDIESSITGGNLGGDGTLMVTFTDATPNSLSFDTFGIRPQSALDTATRFDTSLFQVEFNTVPEPSTLTLIAMGTLGLMMTARRGCRR